jgi:hypothetical protein
MRTIVPSFLVLLPLLLLNSDPGQSQTRKFNPNCGLLGSFAQYRQHNQHCKTLDVPQIKRVKRTAVNKCDPAASKGLGGGAAAGLGGAVGNAGNGVL